jgi:uncharacterized protein
MCLLTFVHMKKLILSSFLCTFALIAYFLLFLPRYSYALTFPQPTGFVNDFANILPTEIKVSLEQKLTNLEKEKSVEFSVVTVPSLQGTTIEDFAVKLFENWKIGKKGQDNGLLFLIAPAERKVRFEVGYGLEGALPDAKTGRILDEYVIPNFKNGDYAKGISDGVDAALAVLSGDPSLSLPNPPKSPNLPMPGEWVFFLVIIAIQYLASFLARSKSFWAGGVLGAIAGIVIGVISHVLLIGLLSAIGLGILGLLLDYVLSKNYDRLKKMGHTNTFWTTLGGFGGGKSSGGFGGFGGGSSGGGGGSRGW